MVSQGLHYTSLMKTGRGSSQKIKFDRQNLEGNGALTKKRKNAEKNVMVRTRREN
jgi:hypothetical protein